MIYLRITVCFVVQFLASRIQSLIIVTNIDGSKGAQPASAPLRVPVLLFQHTHFLEMQAPWELAPPTMLGPPTDQGLIPGNYKRCAIQLYHFLNQNRVAIEKQDVDIKMIDECWPFTMLIKISSCHITFSHTCKLSRNKHPHTIALIPTMVQVSAEIIKAHRAIIGISLLLGN